MRAKGMLGSLSSASSLRVTSARIKSGSECGDAEWGTGSSSDSAAESDSDGVGDEKRDALGCLEVEVRFFDVLV